VKTSLESFDTEEDEDTGSTDGVLSFDEFRLWWDALNSEQGLVGNTG
jgi:hypothetical protein